MEVSKTFQTEALPGVAILDVQPIEEFIPRRTVPQRKEDGGEQWTEIPLDDGEDGRHAAAMGVRRVAAAAEPEFGSGDKDAQGELEEGEDEESEFQDDDDSEWLNGRRFGVVRNRPRFKFVSRTEQQPLDTVLSLPSLRKSRRSAQWQESPKRTHDTSSTKLQGMMDEQAEAIIALAADQNAQEFVQRAEQEAAVAGVVASSSQNAIGLPTINASNEDETMRHRLSLLSEVVKMAEEVGILVGRVSEEDEDRTANSAEVTNATRQLISMRKDMDEGMIRMREMRKEMDALKGGVAAVGEAVKELGGELRRDGQDVGATMEALLTEMVRRDVVDRVNKMMEEKDSQSQDRDNEDAEMKKQRWVELASSVGDDEEEGVDEIKQKDVDELERRLVELGVGEEDENDDENLEEIQRKLGISWGSGRKIANRDIEARNEIMNSYLPESLRRSERDRMNNEHAKTTSTKICGEKEEIAEERVKIILSTITDLQSLAGPVSSEMLGEYARLFGDLSDGLLELRQLRSSKDGEVSDLAKNLPDAAKKYLVSSDKKSSAYQSSLPHDLKFRIPQPPPAEDTDEEDETLPPSASKSHPVPHTRGRQRNWTDEENDDSEFDDDDGVHGFWDGASPIRKPTESEVDEESGWVERARVSEVDVDVEVDSEMEGENGYYEDYEDGEVDQYDDSEEEEVFEYDNIEARLQPAESSSIPMTLAEKRYLYLAYKLLNSVQRLFEEVKDPIYRGAAQVISLHESEPYFLLHVFRLLAKLDSSYLRQRFLIAVDGIMEERDEMLAKEQYSRNEEVNSQENKVNSQEAKMKRKAGNSEKKFGLHDPEKVPDLKRKDVAAKAKKTLSWKSINSDQKTALKQEDISTAKIDTFSSESGPTTYRDSVYGCPDTDSFQDRISAYISDLLSDPYYDSDRISISQISNLKIFLMGLVHSQIDSAGGVDAFDTDTSDEEGNAPRRFGSPGAEDLQADASFEVELTQKVLDGMKPVLDARLDCFANQDARLYRETMQSEAMAIAMEGLGAAARLAFEKTVAGGRKSSWLGDLDGDDEFLTGAKETATVKKETKKAKPADHSERYQSAFENVAATGREIVRSWQDSDDTVLSSKSSLKEQEEAFKKALMDVWGDVRSVGKMFSPEPDSFEMERLRSGAQNIGGGLGMGWGSGKQKGEALISELDGDEDWESDESPKDSDLRRWRRIRRDVKERREGRRLGRFERDGLRRNVAKGKTPATPNDHTDEEYNDLMASVEEVGKEWRQMYFEDVSAGVRMSSGGRSGMDEDRLSTSTDSTIRPVTTKARK
ncbi:hypothetical protein HDU97_000384 [Phlyctochytrium planicorne]|nr:hypothetical protein HDU97_000384 [Phlyctochytrium planicorne]